MKPCAQQRGVAAIEFALVLPLLLVLLLGTIDYGWYFFVEQQTTIAAREAARAASTYPGACPNTAGQTAARSTATARMQTFNFGAFTTVTTTCSTLAGGDPEIAASVQVLFPQLTGFTLIPLPKEGDSVRAFSRATMRGVQ
jgi:Flp pilus assembly protein TadG